jgi:uncharacterized membrane protein YfcA
MDMFLELAALAAGLIATGCIAGVLAGLLGVGWGISALPQASVGQVNLLGLVLIAPFTSMAAPLGVRLANRLSARVLKLLFALFLFPTSARMLVALILT